MRKFLLGTGIALSLALGLLIAGPAEDVSASCALSETGTFCDQQCELKDGRLQCKQVTGSDGRCCWNGDYTCGDSSYCPDCETDCGPGAF